MPTVRANVIPLHPPQDAEIVAAIRARAQGASDALLNAYGRDVERVVARMHGPGDLADIVHDVFVRALEGIDSLRDPAMLRSWLVGIAVRTVREQIRRRIRWKRLSLLPFVEAPAPIAHDPDASEDLVRTYAILEQLDVDERLAFTLRFVAEMELTEVAAACECSLATIKRRLSRAQARFVELARLDPSLSERLAEGARWNDA